MPTSDLVLQILCVCVCVCVLWGSGGGQSRAWDVGSVGNAEAFLTIISAVVISVHVPGHRCPCLSWEAL